MTLIVTTVSQYHPNFVISTVLFVAVPSGHLIVGCAHCTDSLAESTARPNEGFSIDL